MPDRDPLLEDVLGRIAEGAPIDWEALEASAVSDSVRAAIAEARVLHVVSQLARQGAGAAVDAASRETAPETWGHLKLLEKLGEGAYGEVYRAWDSRLAHRIHGRAAAHRRLAAREHPGVIARRTRVGRSLHG